MADRTTCFFNGYSVANTSSSRSMWYPQGGDGLPSTSSLYFLWHSVQAHAQSRHDSRAAPNRQELSNSELCQLRKIRHELNKREHELRPLARCAPGRLRRAVDIGLGPSVNLAIAASTPAVVPGALIDMPMRGPSGLVLRLVCSWIRMGRVAVDVVSLENLRSLGGGVGILRLYDRSGQ